MILSAIYFIIVPYLLSYWTDFIIEWDADIIETTVMRWGVGVATLIAIAPILNLLAIPLHYAIYLFLGIAAVSLALYQHGVPSVPAPSWDQGKTYLVLLVLVAASAAMYLNGAYAYPYLENGDPWNYAAVINTIADEQTYSAPYRYNHYSEPYTQGYQVFLAILHQLNNSVYHTMKLFHQLYLTLGTAFIFFLARRLFQAYHDPDTTALFTTFILVIIPSWVSHFMFSLTFNMVQILVFVYALIKTYENADWWPITGVILGSIIITHQFTAAITLVLFALIMSFRLAKGQLPAYDWNALLTGLGFAAAFYTPLFITYSRYFETPVQGSFGRLELVFLPVAQGYSSHPVIATTLTAIAITAVAAYTYWQPKLQRQADKQWRTTHAVAVIVLIFLALFTFLASGLFHLEGSASQPYTLGHFFKAGPPNMINNPVGLGAITPFLVLLGAGLLLVKRRASLLETDNYDLETFGLFAVFLLLTLGMYFPAFIAPFRMWTFLALPVSILAGIALYTIYASFTNISKATGTIAIAIIAFLLITSTFLPKYQHQTSPWPEHRVGAPASLQLHNTLRANYTGSSVVNLCRSSSYLAGYDVNPPITNQVFQPDWRWPNASTPFHARTTNMSADEIATTLRDNNVSYAVGGASCVDRGEEPSRELRQLMERLQQSNAFTVVEQTESELLFRVS